MFTRTARLKRALDLRDNALAIFSNAKEQLNEVTVRLNNHITESVTLIQHKQAEIEAERCLIEATRAHVQNAVKTIVKINNILGDTHAETN